MSDRIEVIIDSLRVSLTSQNRLILLKEKEGVLSLPLFIGQFEAEAIVIALQEIEISRPQPHDLIRSAVKALDGRILSVEITTMKAASFYAEITIMNADGGIVLLDCRPSDAIAVGLRAHVPIYVNQDLMLNFGIQPEQDIRTQNRPHNPDQGSDEEGLSAFKDFLDNF